MLNRKWKKIPWAIIIAAIGILIGYLISNAHITGVYCLVSIVRVTLELGVDILTLEAEYPTLTLDLVSLPSFHVHVFNLDVLATSFGVAFIAILETLISARIADGITKVLSHFLFVTALLMNYFCALHLFDILSVSMV